MTFQEAIDYLYSRLPLFQNHGTRAYKPGLSGIAEFSQILGNPHERFKSIHVAGTNGKGSTSHMIASVLQAAGYSVGLYTSPHLKSFTERIRIDGEEIDQGYVAEFVTRHSNYIESKKPSFFEVTVAMAFNYFADSQVHIAVVEVGMGGRLDSTNIITPEVAVITNIGWDHMQHLGGTLPLIAQEKSGIIKRHVPLVMSEMPDPEVLEVFTYMAQRMESEMVVASNELLVTNHDFNGHRQTVELLRKRDNYIQSYELDLSGTYQIENLKGALTVLEILELKGYDIDAQDVQVGLGTIVATTGLRGRWQILQRQPIVIADTAHNLDGLRRTIGQFCTIPANRHHFILGFVADKDVRKILSLFPSDATYYFCQPSVDRALDVGSLVSIAGEIGLSGNSTSNVNEALLQTLKTASPKDAIYVGGSTFVVADLNQI